MTLVAAQTTLAHVPTDDLIDELRRRDPGAVVLTGADYARRLDDAYAAGRGDVLDLLETD
jgi:hypothetical protein